MIRMVYLLRRRADVAFETFQNIWLNEHARLVEKHAKDLGIQRYVQLHTLVEPVEPTVDPMRGQMQIPFDGVAEYWFESIEAVTAAFLNQEAINRRLIEDEKRFVDHSQSCAWIAYEVPHINPTPEDIVAAPGSTVTRLFYALNQPTGQSVEQAQWYWRVEHGPLVRGYGQDIQTKRYIQVHRLEHELNDYLAQARGLSSAYYGHAELWFDSTSEPQARAQQAAVGLYEDEVKFIDFSRSAIWYGKEHVLIESRLR